MPAAPWSPGRPPRCWARPATHTRGACSARCHGRTARTAGGCCRSRAGCRTWWCPRAAPLIPAAIFAPAAASRWTPARRHRRCNLLAKRSRVAIAPSSSAGNRCPAASRPMQRPMARRTVPRPAPQRPPMPCPAMPCAALPGPPMPCRAMARRCCWRTTCRARSAAVRCSTGCRPSRAPCTCAAGPRCRRWMKFRSVFDRVRCSVWWASPAVASRRSAGCCCGCCRPMPDD